MHVYHRTVTLTVKAPGAGELLVTWQGCAEAGLSYPPQTRTVTLAAPSARGVQQHGRQATVAGRP
jgi:thiol:disulfide interchange protein DsbD